METAGFELLDNIPSSLRSPARGEHRIQDDRAVVMKRNPIVREDRIRSMELFHIFDQNDLDSCFSQPARKHVELNPRPPLDVPAAGFRRFSRWLRLSGRGQSFAGTVLGFGRIGAGDPATVLADRRFRLSCARSLAR